MSSFEIERKWVLDSLPSFLDKEETDLIEQCYVSFSPEVRIRRSMKGKNKYKITFKSEGVLKRTEIEDVITEETYENLKKFFVNPYGIVNKRFYVYHEDGIKYEISLVDDIWFYAEVEFKNEDDANEFIPPAWLGREVTDKPHFKMKNYAEQKTKFGRAFNPN